MLGEILAVGCALAWACAVIFFKKSEAIPPQGLNLFKNVVGSVCLALTLAIMGDGIDWERSTEDWVRLTVSGVVGIALADTLFFMALKRIGPGLLAIVECAYAPSVVVLSMLHLGERVGLAFAAGAVLVLGGIFIATWERPAADLAPRDRRVGIILGVAAVVFMAIGVVIAKPALERGGLIEVTLIRLVAGVVGQLLWVLPSRERGPVLRTFLPQRVWRTLLPGSLLGAYIAMIAWIGGMKYTDASIAAVLNQLSTVFILVLAHVFLEEALTKRRITGGAAAVVGAAIIVAAASG